MVEWVNAHSSLLAPDRFRASGRGFGVCSTWCHILGTYLRCVHCCQRRAERPWTALHCQRSNRGLTMVDHGVCGQGGQGFGPCCETPLHAWGQIMAVVCLPPLPHPSLFPPLGCSDTLTLFSHTGAYGEVWLAKSTSVHPRTSEPRVATQPQSQDDSSIRGQWSDKPVHAVHWMANCRGLYSCWILHLPLCRVFDAHRHSLPITAHI